MIARAVGTLVEEFAFAGTIFLRVPLETYLFRRREKVIYMTAFIVILIGISSKARYQ